MFTSNNIFLIRISCRIKSKIETSLTRFEKLFVGKRLVPILKKVSKTIVYKSVYTINELTVKGPEPNKLLHLSLIHI